MTRANALLCEAITNAKATARRTHSTSGTSLLPTARKTLNKVSHTVDQLEKRLPLKMHC
jgi:hypothetical protein